MKPTTICEQCGALRLPGDSACRYCGAIYSDTFEAPRTGKKRPIAQSTRTRPAKPRAEPLASEPSARVRQAADRFGLFTPWEAHPESGEILVGVIPYITCPKGFLGLEEDKGTMLITSERLIFAVASEALGNRMEAEFEQALDEHEGRPKKSWRQFILERDWSAACWQHYLTQPPDTSLAENPLNSMIGLDEVKAIEIFLDDDEHSLDDMQIKTCDGKVKFDMFSGVGQVAQELLGRVLSDRVFIR